MRGSARVLGPRAIPGDQMPGLRHVDPHPKPLPMRPHSASPLPNSLDPTGVVAYRLHRDSPVGGEGRESGILPLFLYRKRVPFRDATFGKEGSCPGGLYSDRTCSSTVRDNPT